MPVTIMLSSKIEKRKKSIGLAVLFLIFFSPALAYLTIGFNGGNTLLFEDGLLQSFPFRAFIRSAFVNGFSPQWVPNSACGFSLLAEGQNGICFPSTQIIYRIFSAETGWLLEMLLAQLVSFILCYLLLRHFRVSRISSLFGSCVYAFCAPTFVAVSVPAIMWCYSLLPGIFLSCDHFIERRPFSFVYLTAVFALIFLTGHPVMIIYIAMMVALYFVFRLVRDWRSKKSIRETGRRFWILLASASLAALIASPQLLPMLQEYRFSARTAGAAISLEALQNTLYLDPKWVPLSLFPTPFQWNEWEFWSNHVRFPLYALFLGFAGALFGAKGPGRNYFLFLCMFSILMALGPYVGLWKFVHSLPVLRHFRFPFRWLFFLPICVSFLSARSMDRFLNAPDAFTPATFARIVKFLLFGGVVAGAVLFIRHHNKFSQQIRTSLEISPWLTGLLWICTLGMLVAVFLTVTKNATRSGVMLGAAFTVVSLSATLAFEIQDPMVIKNLGTIGWKGDKRPQEPQAYRTSSAMKPYGVWMKAAIDRHYPYTANLTVLNGTLTTGHYFSFFPYWAANVSTWCQDALKGDHTKQIYLNLSSARWLFPSDSSSSEKPAYPAGYFQGMKAYKNPDAIPRASVVFSQHLFSDESDLISFLESSGDFDPRRDAAILRQDAKTWNLLLSDANAPKAAAIPPKATIVTEKPDLIEIELEPAPLGAFLVLSDTYYPGWRALVDGVETKVLRTNYAFRGIKLPAGAKHAVFFYDPLIPDAALFLPTLLLAALGVAMGLRHYSINKRN